MQAALVLATAALGIVAGGYGAFATQVTAAGLPLGALAVTVANGAVTLLLARGSGRLAPVLGYAAGWLVPMLVLGASRPEGDLVVTSEGRSLATLLGGALGLLPGYVSALRTRASPDPPPGR